MPIMILFGGGHIVVSDPFPEQELQSPLKTCITPAKMSNQSGELSFIAKCA